MRSALLFLVQTIADLYLLTFLLRFIMQWVRASYYNPLAQFVFKVTNPLVVPARRMLPSVAGLDAPTLVVLLLLEIAVTFLLLTLAGASVPVPDLLFYSLLRLISMTLLFYTVALFIYVLLSWFGGRGGNPMAEFLGDLVEPLLRPVRRILPPIAGLDLSPLVVLLLLHAVRIALPFPPFLAYLR
jgi:YggT family protein